jgi:hypothetical protein
MSRRIRIEAEEAVKERRCSACGGTNRLLHGFVYADEQPHGVYFVEWCDGVHPERAAFLTVGLGAFGEGTAARAREAFGIEWKADGMRLTDEPVRDRPDLLGDFVPRGRALASANLDELWHVADHIVLDDPRLPGVRAWLEER